MSDEAQEPRHDHLLWCKQRARVYLDRGDSLNAWASFMSDMREHPETAKHPALDLGMMLLINGCNRGTEEMRAFIEGFH